MLALTRIVVTRHGRPAFVLVHPNYLASLEETLEITADPEAMASLARSRREAAEGQLAPLRRS